MEQEPKTLNEMLKKVIGLYGDSPAFKTKKAKDKKFKSISYREIYNRIEGFGTGLKNIGVNESDHIALISENRLEWIIADLATIGLRAVDVPQPGGIGSQDIYFKLNHSDSKAAILEGEKEFSNFYNVEKDLPEIKNIVLIDKVNMFSKKDDAPEWITPINFEEKSRITKEFYSQIKSLSNNHNKNIFLSKDAKDFLKGYLDKNIENVLESTSNNKEQNKGIIKEKILKKAVVLDDDFYKRHLVFSFERVERIGEKILKEGDKSFSEISERAEPNDLVTIIYTSGTTGSPKGVMLTNLGLMYNIKLVPELFDVNEKDRFLSILPSWHIFERIVEYCAMSVGASTAYSKPFKQRLLPDLKEEKPTIMVSVPRIWEGLYDGIMNNVKKEKSYKKFMFKKAIDIAKKYKKAERILNKCEPLFSRINHTEQEIAESERTHKKLRFWYNLADKIVFKKIKEMLGGKTRFVISAGGALSETMDKFYNAIGINILEGYGLTETSPVVSIRTLKNNVIHTVGPIVRGTEVKIVDKEDHSKEIANGKIGIIWVKGPQIMRGYYKNQEKTNEVIKVINKEKWFNTGDLGKKTYNGKYLKICGRIKDTIVLRGGENIEPLVLEDKLNESGYINQVIVVGQDKARLGALIVPDLDALKEYAKKEKIEYKSIEELIENKNIISLFQKEQKRLISKEQGFKPYETVMGVRVLPQEFTIEAGDLTETLKMRRFEIH
ncbi:MAG: long-chain fatty acid--CoA ligase, partial [Nanoarchaeota archaeon]|nr:long-chain fatty acid--CoA ligase [Nanoarchaeota archaeon]